MGAHDRAEDGRGGHKRAQRAQRARQPSLLFFVFFVRVCGKETFAVSLAPRVPGPVWSTVWPKSASWSPQKPFRNPHRLVAKDGRVAGRNRFRHGFSKCLNEKWASNNKQPDASRRKRFPTHMGHPTNVT
jgi:hypothetical protein